MRFVAGFVVEMIDLAKKSALNQMIIFYLVSQGTSFSSSLALFFATQHWESRVATQIILLKIDRRRYLHNR